MTDELNIIIVTYNSEDSIERCIDSINSQETDRKYKIIVVDNSSSDRTVEIIEKRYPELLLVKSNHNGGYASGLNLGLRNKSKGDCLILNPDTEIINDSISKMHKALSKNVNAGIVGPAILDSAGKTILSSFRFTDLFQSIWTAAGLQLLAPFNRSGGRFELRRTAPGKCVKVDRLLGAVMLIKSEVLEGIGKFDERFFLYSEEEDYCLRATKAGWDVIYEPAARVRHAGALSSEQLGTISVAAANWSRHLYMLKHHGWFTAQISRLMWILMLSVRMATTVVGKLIGIPSKNFEGYYLSFKCLLFPGYFDRKLRPEHSTKAFETAV